MNGHLFSWQDLPARAPCQAGASRQATPEPTVETMTDVIEALKHLGYSRGAWVNGLCYACVKVGAVSFEDMFRAAVQEAQRVSMLERGRAKVAF